MSYTFEKTGDNKAVFTLTIAKETVEAGMRKAAETLAKDTTIPGFRPGKAPYEQIVARHGEMKLLDIAAEDLIRAEFVDALTKEDIRTIGQPFFTPEKLAPGNDLVIKAEIALYPNITKLADPTKLSVEKKSTEPSSEDVEAALKNLADLQATEERQSADHQSAEGDKIVATLTLRDKDVVIEGGEPKDMSIQTDQNAYIPGFLDAVIGIKEGETRTFNLTFPTDYYAKHLAGREITFEVAAKEVYARVRPEIDDEFAKKLGLESKENLMARLKENLEGENASEELRRQDTEILNLLTEKSTYETFPDILVNQEVDRMVQELEYNVEQSGGVFEDYLKQIGKSLADIKLDFTPTAIKRIQASLYIAAYAKEHNIVASEEMMNEFMKDAAAQYGERAQEYVNNPRYRAYAEERLIHGAVLRALRETMVK